MCMWVCVFLCLSACVFILQLACGGQRTTLGVSPCFSLCFRQGLGCSTAYPRLAGSGASGESLGSASHLVIGALEFQMCSPTPSFT